VLSARSAVRSAEVAAENASRERTRQERLLAVEAVPEKDVESARSAAESAEASLADARSRLASAEQELGYAHVTAPFDGVVSERAVSAGDVVQGGDELFTVMDPTSMRLEASVPAEALDAVRVGTAVSFSVRGYGNRRFEGRITRVSPAADPATRQVDIFASIPNAGSLVTGLFASGRIATETREGLVVPISAVDTREIAPAVVRVRGGRVERVPVTLGLRDEVSQRVEVARGVTESDTLLTGTAQQLSAGSRVVVSAAKLSDTTEGLRLEARR
jgi:membrane fusion protein, multidrug efflux system